MVDKIRMRKIRYDVLEHFDIQNLIEKINFALKNKEKYKENFDELIELQRESNLDLSKNTFEEIVTQLEKFVEDCNNVESITHLPLLDYIQEVNDKIDREEDEDFILEETQEFMELQNFLLQLIQIQKLQYLLIEKIKNIFYIGNDKNVYDIKTNTIIIKAADLGLENSATEDDVVIGTLSYIMDSIMKQQRKIILNLDFDDDGIYLTFEGENIFTEEDNKEIFKQLNEWMSILFKNSYNEELLNNKSADSKTITDVLDDVTID